MPGSDPTQSDWQLPALAGLSARADQYLVDADIGRLADRVEHRVRDVLCGQRRDALKAFCHRLEDLGTVVAGQLGCHRTRLDDRYPYAERDCLLAQRLREGADAE